MRRRVNAGNSTPATIGHQRKDFLCLLLTPFRPDIRLRPKEGSSRFSRFDGSWFKEKLMSNLTALTLANFKAFKDEQQIPIRPITLLYGQNSAGKSSIIDALLLMHHFATDGIPDQRSKGVFFDQVSFDFTVTGSPVRLGDVDEFVHGKDLANNIQLGLRMTH